MKKIVNLFIFLLLILLSSCSEDENTLKVGVDFYPMPELMELITPKIKEDGYNVKLVHMDYNVLNTPLFQKEIDANLIQHEHFMNFFNQSNQANLVVATPIYHSIFAIYSNVFKSLDEIPNNETIYLPEDVVNLPRALMLLESANLITLNGKTFDATLDDITDNPKNLNFKLETLMTTPLAYKDNGKRLAVMYPSYAHLQIGLTDDSEFLFKETLNDLTKTYAISMVVREDMLDNPKILSLINHLTSDLVKDYITQEYGWAAIPAF
ncbi:MAG: MetQ/NlpA family ABC transporter substrate-binding protein [Acholeplasmataceae bacterium]